MTLRTSTGIWSVQYNAENRPIRWQSGDTVITMAFDRMGRRIEIRTQSADSNLLQRFVYDNYLCVQQLRTPSNTLYHSYIWDPTEPIATHPLVFIPSEGETAYYFHDGNKNVSDLVDVQSNIVHYAYTPFGSPTASAPSENPLGFSSEYTDNELALAYYNYRHYSFVLGRWCSKDPIGENDGDNLFVFVANSPFHTDWLGLLKKQIPFQDGERDIVLGKIPMLPGSEVRHRIPNKCIAEVEYETWGKCSCENGESTIDAGINIIETRFLSGSNSKGGIGVSVNPIGVSISITNDIKGSGSNARATAKSDGSLEMTVRYKITIVKASVVVFGFSFGGVSADDVISENATILATDGISYTHRCAKEDFK